MANAPRRAERLRRETIGGEQFVAAGDEADGVPLQTAPGKIVRANPGVDGATDPQQARMAQIRGINAAGKAFLDALNALGSSRELSIARQRLEEAVLWSIKHVSK